MEISESLGKRLLRLREKESVSVLLASWTATGFGLGYLPLAPGTWASLATAAVWFLMYSWLGEAALIFHLPIICLLFPLAWKTSGVAARMMGDGDPRAVVIDEMFGQSLPFLLVPVNLWTTLGAFGLFRFFDILKPFPIRRCERLPGGLGIVMDDCAAGLYAAAVLAVLQYVIHAS
ncbi:MAG: phosphatidylglycerophosphatase A [Acidobacteriota bacterium]